MAHGRFKEHVARLKDSVFQKRGESAPAVRAAVGERAARLVEGSFETRPGESAIPDQLDSYADTVIRHAYMVADADMERLKAAGYSDDQVFEVTVAAAVGAGVSRLERALRLLKEEG